MSKLDIKKDFIDGKILPAQDLNNNFYQIENGMHDLEELKFKSTDDKKFQIVDQIEEYAKSKNYNYLNKPQIFFAGNTISSSVLAITSS